MQGLLCFTHTPNCRRMIDADCISVIGDNTMLKFFFRNPLATLWTICIGLLAYMVLACCIGLCLYTLILDQSVSEFDKIVALVAMMFITALDIKIEKAFTVKRLLRVFVADICSLAIPVYIVVTWLLLKEW